MLSRSRAEAAAIEAIDSVGVAGDPQAQGNQRCREFGAGTEDDTVEHRRRMTCSVYSIILCNSSCC